MKPPGLGWEKGALSAPLTSADGMQPTRLGVSVTPMGAEKVLPY